MRNSGFAILVAIGILLVSSAPCLAAAPAWQKNFAVTGGEMAAVPVPNMGQGKVRVVFEWTGSPLAVSVTGGGTTVLLPAAVRNPPSHSFEFDTSSANPSAVPVFVVRVALAGNPGPGASASGRISVSPPPDAARLDAFEAPLRQKAAAMRQSEPAQPAALGAQADAQIKAANKAIADRNLALSQSLRSQAIRERGEYAGKLQAMARPAMRASQLLPAAASARAGAAGMLAAGSASAGGAGGSSSSGGAGSAPPVPPPAVTYIDPVEVGPQSQVTIDGNNFAQGDMVRLALPGVFDAPVPTAFVNATRLTAVVPAYTARQIGNGSLKIERQGAAGPVSSPPSTLVFRPTVPAITALPASAVADEPFLIRGMGFGQSGEVHAVDGNGVDGVLTVDSWTDTHIVARGPSVYGFTGSKSYQLYVKDAAGRKGDGKPLPITPATEVRLMEMNELKTTKDYVLALKGSPWSGVLSNNPLGAYMYGRHQADMFTGYKGDDQYFLSRRLKNGWKVDRVDFRNDSPSSPVGGAATSLWESRPGTDSPYIKVHWWCEAMWNMSIYQFSIQIRGPKGTAY